MDRGFLIFYNPIILSNTYQVFMCFYITLIESLQNKIEKGFSAEDIRKSWQKDIDEFQKIRIKYLIYK